MKKTIKIVLPVICVLLGIFLVGAILPEHYIMPYGTTDSYNHESFWWHPWTRGVNGSPHTGVDIFGKEGSDVFPAVEGLVIYSGWYGEICGNSVFVLGPKWKIHMYFHLKEALVRPGQMVSHDTVIGHLGKTGNARTTPAHVHYSIVTPLPHVGQYSRVYGKNTQPRRYNWMKMFYLNPDDYLREDK